MIMSGYQYGSEPTVSSPANMTNVGRKYNSFTENDEFTTMGHHDRISMLGPASAPALREWPDA